MVHRRFPLLLLPCTTAHKEDRLLSGYGAYGLIALGASERQGGVTHVTKNVACCSVLGRVIWSITMIVGIDLVVLHLM